MLLANDLAVGLIVQQDVFRTVADEDGERGGHDDLDKPTQLGVPCIDRAEGRCRPGAGQEEGVVLECSGGRGSKIKPGSDGKWLWVGRRG